MLIYSAIEKNKIMSFAKNWVELEIIILNELIQTQKDKNHIFLLNAYNSDFKERHDVEGGNMGRGRA
jgi:hypothetical protein